MPKSLVKHDLAVSEASEARDSSDEFAAPRLVCRKQRLLSADDAVRLVDGYRDGKTVYELGREFGIHRVTVSAHLKRAGVPMRRLGLDESLRAEITRLRDEGWSYARLGERYNVDPATVRRFHLLPTVTTT